MFASQGIHIFHHDVAIALPRLVVVLHVDRINGGLGIDLPHGDIVRAIADFHRTAQPAVVTTHVIHQHISNLSAFAAAATDGDRVANHAATDHISHHAAHDILVVGAVCLDHHSVLRAVQKCSAFD